MTDEGGQVAVARDDPPYGCTPLGPVEAKHGDGCGLYGKQGKYLHAYNHFRNVAAKMGANYVRIDDFTKPHFEGRWTYSPTTTYWQGSGFPTESERAFVGCYRNAFVLRGSAYYCPNEPVHEPKPKVPSEPPCMSDEEFTKISERLESEYASGNLPEERFGLELQRASDARCNQWRSRTHDLGFDPGPDTPTRLRELEELHSNGLITDEEYQSKRAEILEEL